MHALSNSDGTAQSKRPDAVVTGVTTPALRRPDRDQRRPAPQMAQPSNGGPRRSAPHPTEGEFLAPDPLGSSPSLAGDSIWAATLSPARRHKHRRQHPPRPRSLARAKSDPDTAEQPGKIMHELRQASLRSTTRRSPSPRSITAPSTRPHYGFASCTTRGEQGSPTRRCAALLPALHGALAWMRDFGDADGDGSSSTSTSPAEASPTRGGRTRRTASNGETDNSPTARSRSAGPGVCPRSGGCTAPTC